MLSPHADFQSHIALDKLKIAEIYDVTLVNGDVYYYTSHSKNITWSETYVSLPIRRSPIEYKMNLSADDVTISLANISGDLFDLLMNNAVDAAVVVIKRIIWDETYDSDMELILFQGIADLEFDRRILTLHCRSSLDGLNVQVPKNLYQEECNNRLFDTLCILTQSDYALAGSATSDGGDGITLIDSTRGSLMKVAFDGGDSSNPVEIGDALVGGDGGGTAVCTAIVYSTSATGTLWYANLVAPDFVDDEVITGGGNTVTVNGTPAEDTEFYALGEVEMTSDLNDGYRRMILSHSGNNTVLAVAFPNEILSGDAYNIYPGCDKRATTCRDKFDNENNFHGYLYGPKIEETIM